MKEVEGKKTFFHYSDEGLVAELDEQGKVIRSYSWRPGSAWSTNPLVLFENGKTPYFYYNNHLGAPLKLTDKQGRVVWSATYSAFGKAEITLVEVTNNLRLPGQYFDRETGLHYNFQRYYDPDTGRYITADPIGLRGGINLYANVLNDPVNWVDPWGLWASKGGFYVHQRVTYLLIGKKLGRELNAVLAEAHVYADSAQFQTSNYSYRHAMRGEINGAVQTVDEARQLANEFVREQFKKAWQYKAKCDDKAALHEFGLALHTLQDSTSPAHHGFQLWTGHETRPEEANHALQELFNPGEGSELYRITRDAWRWYQQGNLPDVNIFSKYGEDKVDFPLPISP